ncbi:MAG: ATP-binding protein [bacterium]
MKPLMGSTMAIFDDRLEIWSEATLPSGLKPEDLKREHPSRPRNPLISKAFYLRGVIERWGMGTLNIIDWCTENGNPAPKWSEHAGSVFVTFFPAVTEEVGTKLGLSQDQVKILHTLFEEKRIKELMAALRRKNRTKFRD